MAESPHSGYNATVQDFREIEYPMLKGSIYLDHAGSTLCAKSVMDMFAMDMTSTLYGNPHSGSWSSQLSSSRIEDVRLRLLDFFQADPTEYDLVFVANTTAGIKLVTEALRTLPHGFSYVYHQACHTSLVGVREEATESICVNDCQMKAWIDGEAPFKDSSSASSATLLSYSAQSHLNGTRYPLSWAKQLRSRNTNSKSTMYTLLDVASLSATSPLNLSHPDFAADFIVLSLYKIFGFPDLGALLVRRASSDVFSGRKYFGGGTVDAVTCHDEPWHAFKSNSLHERLEDGTLPFHNIIAADFALQVHARLFGSMARIREHTSYLTERLIDGLSGLRHGNEQPVCVMYTGFAGENSMLGQGPVVAFNIKNSSGAWVSLAEFEKLAILKHIHIRTGSLCSPGGIASVLDLTSWEMRKNYSAGFRCGSDNDIIHGKPTGVIRASLGAMSTLSDVTQFIDFVAEFFVEATKTTSSTEDTHKPRHDTSLMVKSITVFPIKSCGGYNVPPGMQWEVRPEGLAWDREWCLVHRGSSQALSQKRYPKMALLQPSIDLDRGILHVKYNGAPMSRMQNRVTISLLANSAPFKAFDSNLTSRVCGEKVSVLFCISEEINDFFSEAIGVPCVLARFPPGGQGLKSRSTKANLLKRRQGSVTKKALGVVCDVPSPPDSDAEKQDEGKILLSNESPILMITTSSVAALNADVKANGGDDVAETAFRGNIIVEDPRGTLPPYAEDEWQGITIGSRDFKLLGGCQRCHMVCIDQVTGEKKPEPFVTLAKTRRYNGKVYFGAHMRLDVGKSDDDSLQKPTISVGEAVLIRDAS
ncbi:MOSC N-terminal beta barrel domain-containing protein [Stachybotrys elegans]|uniref:Molybdenum cofactor sulfurase n=1 Tax=Stachybotrys elegans TaxID=80388 RepID=A0A8K0WT51_9HYPO|nr:MOSC N-terminal beta barrel domain-containing protein [Stachybotrys elegans]